MKTNPDKINENANASSQMPKVDGKKILAGGLVIVLAFMWIRVFLGGPDTTEQADAQVTVENTGNPPKKVIKFKRRKLPFEFGRHDRLTTDMFSSSFIRNKKSDGSEDTPDHKEKIRSQKEAADRLAKKLELEAIILGSENLSHKAFINGKIIMIDDELEVKLNDVKYELVVAEIFHNKVVLKWNDYTISVRMAKLKN